MKLFDLILTREGRELLFDLLSTKEGGGLLRHRILGSKEQKQLELYRKKAEDYLDGFINRTIRRLYRTVKYDKNPGKTTSDLAYALRLPGLRLERDEAVKARESLSDISRLKEDVYSLSDSKLIKMPTPPFLAILDGTKEYVGIDVEYESCEMLLDGHVGAIMVGEGSDRVVDREGDGRFLTETRLLCAYLYNISKDLIQKDGGNEAIRRFEKGLEGAIEGQRIDLEIKHDPSSITWEKIEGCYKGKIYDPVTTTAENMTLGIKPYDDIFGVGGGKLAEASMVGDDFQDTRRYGKIDIPSWLWLFGLGTGDVEKALELARDRGRCYIQEARIALNMLPDDFPTKPFFKILFPVVGFYLVREYKRAMREVPRSTLEKQLSAYV